MTARKNVEAETPEPIEVPEPSKPKGYDQETGEFVV